MRREVVERALPFPDVPSEQYHDHWLGLVALSMGDVAYVDRPLYDYVQHRGAALGHAKANAGIEGRGGLRERIGISYWRGRFAAAHAAYFRSYVRLELLARALLERVPEASRGKRSALKRFVWADRSRAGIVWLRLRGLRGLVSNETLGAERMLAESLLWRHGMRHHSRDWERPIGSPFDASLPSAEGESTGEAAGEAYPDPETAHIERLLAPLGFRVSAAEPERVNILIPTIDLRHLFGGYIAKFNLARKLAEAGHRVRIVTVDPTPELPADWRAQVESYSGLAGAMSTIEVAFAREQGEVVISPRDRFVATTWWTAYHARDAISHTEGERFLYLIQEYEPFTFVMGSWAAVAAETYSFPHAALFSTEFLRAYFAANRIGVYSDDSRRGRPGLGLVSERDHRREDADGLGSGGPREQASALLCPLRAAREAEHVRARDDRHFEGNRDPGLRRRVGVLRDRLGLRSQPGGARRRKRARRPAASGQSKYGEILGGYDIGLSLMLTPHPSLVPIEMASAGILTVTNTFETKTAERLTAISGESDPGRSQHRGGGRRTRCRGWTRRRSRRADTRGAVDWSDDWEESLDGPIMSHVERLLGLE